MTVHVLNMVMDARRHLEAGLVWSDQTSVVVTSLSNDVPQPLSQLTLLSLPPLLPDPNGCVYQSVVALRRPVESEGPQALPRSLLLRLPVGEGQLGAASAVSLDEAHVAVVGVPHPSAGAGRGKHTDPPWALSWGLTPEI